MHSSFFYGLTALATLGRAAPVGSTPLNCKEVMIPVHISAENFQLPSNLTDADLTVRYLRSLGNQPNHTVSGSYNIGARYCEPLNVVTDRQNTLQLLVHGVTYTRNYWSGLAAPGTRAGQDEYSWILYAAKQGYPTLSIDRLCNGVSSHPDGISACQTPLQAEAVHALITMARAGRLQGPENPRRFNKIIVVGHSDGSILTNNLSLRYPHDADMLLFTGFSYNITNSIAAFATLTFKPAAQADPSRFGHLGSSYLVATNESAFEDFYFYGDFSRSLVEYNFAHGGTVTVGEFASILLGQQPAPQYSGPLFVLDGEEDKNFCSLSTQAAARSAPGKCSAGLAQAVHGFYPASSTFGYSATPNTGHCLNLHHTAQQSYKVAHDYLAKVGF